MFTMVYSPNQEQNYHLWSITIVIPLKTSEFTARILRLHKEK